MVSIDDDEGFTLLCRLCDVDPAEGPRAVVERRVCGRLGGGAAARWETVLAEAGLPVAVVCEDLASVPADPRLADLFEPVGMGGLAPRSPWTFA
jgi:hypothetical protein